MLFSLPRALLCGLACLVTLAVVQARGADPKAAPADPKAVKLLDDVIKTYRALSSYTDEGKFVLNITDNGKPQNESSPLRVSFARPNKVDLDTGVVRMVSDGKTLTTTVSPLKKYIAGDAPKRITFETFAAGPAGSILFGGPTAPPAAILLNLLVGDDPAKVIAELGGSIKLVAGHKDGQAIRIERGEGPGFELVVDPGTKLLKGIYLVIDPAVLAKSAADGRKITIEKFGWEAGKVSTKGLKEDAFAFQPPKSFSKVESFARAGGGEDSYRVKELVGKPAPDFTLTVLDGEKTRTLGRDDLAGKVVLIDFWATWCGPCLRELPEVQKMIEAYAKDKKEVLIVALSQDKEPSELAGVRKLVEKTLEDKKVVLTGTKVGLIALDPSQTVGDAFGVEAIPTLVILDGKGTVQAAYVGQQTGETLTKDIDALLGGKSLLKPKAAEAAAKKEGGAKD